MRQLRLYIVRLAAQLVKVLLHLRIGYAHVKLHGELRHTVVAFRRNLTHIGQGAQLVLHHLRHLQLYLMCRGTHIGHHHHGLLHGHRRILQLGHPGESENTRQQDAYHQRPEQGGSFDKKLRDLHQSNPPMLVFTCSSTTRTCSLS